MQIALWLVAVAMSASLSVAAYAAGGKTTYDPTSLSVQCRFQGGTYYPPSPECGGCFGCILPNGDVIHCQSDNSCDVLNERAGGRIRFAVTALALAIQQRIPATPPDLVALPMPASTPPEGFCRRNDQGQLLVQVHNQGTTEAAASQTRISFRTTQPFDVATPAIPAGTSTQLTVDIPNACFDASNNCAFTLGVDAAGALAEADETNNNAAGLCGPQFQ